MADRAPKQKAQGSSKSQLGETNTMWFVFQLIP